MAKFRKKPVVIEATQWFKNGDHPAIEPIYGAGVMICGVCGHPSNKHAWCETLEGKLFVCVGDWIITGVEGENYPCKPGIFEATYEPIVENDDD